MSVVMTEYGAVIPGYGLGLVVLPNYLYWLKGRQAWSVNCKELGICRNFYLEDYGTYGKAFEAALEYHRKVIDESMVRMKRKVATKEPGINYYQTKAINVNKHYFAVSLLNRERVSLYIGTDNNFSKRWSEALERAVRLRERATGTYITEWRWRGIRPEIYCEKVKHEVCLRRLKK